MLLAYFILQNKTLS